MSDTNKNTEKNQFDVQQKKLQTVCGENELRYEFNYDTYPVTLIVRPNTQVPGQMSLLGSESKKMSGASCIKFFFKDGAISYEIHNGFVISDAVFSKIKGLFKKNALHPAAVHLPHRDRGNGRGHYRAVGG